MAPENNDNLSICEAGDGLFDTHVTWEDIERNMQSAFGSKATFGPNKTVKNIGEGSGFLSKICLIEADWQNADPEEKLPEKFVAKLCTGYTCIAYSQKNIDEGNGDPAMYQASIDKCLDMETDLCRFHNSECDAFTLLAKYGVAERVKMPKLYYAQKFSDENTGKGHIIMEALEELHPIHVIDNLPVEAVKQVLRCLAVMQAASLRFTDEERQLFPTQPFGQIYAKWIESDTNGMYTNVLRACGEPGQFDELTNKLEQCIEQIRQYQQYDNIPQRLGMRRVLCHGDLWSTNKVWRIVDGEYKLAAILDFQIANFGAPGVDLTRLFMTTLSGKERRENFEKLIETFYGYLLEELKGQEAPYTLEQLKLNYELYFPGAAYLVFPVVSGPVIAAASEKSPASAAEIKALIAEKVQCIIEDTIYYFEKHQKNSK